jgi:hypothetical protein
MSQLRPCIWYSRILPPLITLGWICTRQGAQGQVAGGGTHAARGMG